MKKIAINSLKIDEDLVNFINNEAIPGTNIDSKKFWSSFDDVIHRLAPKNRELIDKREEIQQKIDGWHLSKKVSSIDKNEYINFLKSIGYIIDEKNDFEINTSNVDKEISSIIEKQYQRAIRILKKNKKKLIQLAEVLLTKEVIFKDNLEEIFGKRPFDKDLETK